MADDLSRHLGGDVITPVPPPLLLPDGEGLCAVKLLIALARGRFVQFRTSLKKSPPDGGRDWE